MGSDREQTGVQGHAPARVATDRALCPLRVVCADGASVRVRGSQPEQNVVNRRKGSGMSGIRLMVAVVLGLLWLWAGFSVQPSFAQGAATVAVTGARLIDGTGRPPIERATLLIEDGRVQAAGPSASVQIPAGAVRVDATGKTIIPGLISSHTHVGSEAQRLLYAQYGITTVYSLGSGPGNAAVRDEVTLDRARLFAAPGVRATSAGRGQAFGRFQRRTERPHDQDLGLWRSAASSLAARGGSPVY